MTNIVITTAVILLPGDKVLLTTKDDDLLDNANEARKILQERFPGVEFTFVGGVMDTLVERADRFE